jgi:mRNA interferase HigB
MKLLYKKLLHDFKEKHADARSQIESWEAEVEEAQWSSSADLKRRYPKASLLKDQYVIFNICWNKYRLLVQVGYKTSIVLIKKIGTHKEYDKWNIG